MELIACLVMLSICLYLYYKNVEMNSKLKKIETIVQDDSHRYYVICPECGRKIILTDVRILALEQELNDSSDI